MKATETAALVHRHMRADAHRNAERLLAAAKTAFAEHGVSASLEDIARDAGVGIGTLYRHFPTRQALLEAVLRDYLEALRAKATNLLTSPSPVDGLAAWLRFVVVQATAYQGLAATFEAILRDERSTVWSFCLDVLAAGEELLTRAQDSGAVQADVDFTDLVKLVHAIAWATEKTDDPARADRLLTLVMDGLRPR